MDQRTTFHIRGDTARGGSSQSVFDVNVSFLVAVSRYDPFQHRHSGDWYAVGSRPALHAAVDAFLTFEPFKGAL